MASSGRQPALASPIWVDSARSFRKMLDHVERVAILALDTESDSLYRYAPKVCLVQMAVPSVPGEADPYQVTDYLVDSLRMDVRPLGDLVADSTVQSVMHAAENDILTLGRDFGFTFANIFDTQLAARILGWQGVGLASMLEREFGVVSDKRMQRTNWGQRPLTAQQIAYAQVDAHYLLALRARLVQELKAAGRWQEAQEAFAALLRIDFSDKGQNRRSVWTMRLARTVPMERMALLEELWLWREARAERLDRPPFKVMGDRVLLELAKVKPAGLDQLVRINGLNSRQVDQFGAEIVAAVNRGRRRPQPQPPEQNGYRLERLEPQVQARYDALRSWRTATAKQRGVDADIVFSNDILLAIVNLAPSRPEDLLRLEAIGPWKAREYGPAIVDVLNRHA